MVPPAGTARKGRAMTSWAASSGDPFDAVRKFFQDLQDSWGQPRSGQSEHHRGGGKDSGNDWGARRDDRWDTSQDDRPGESGGPHGEPGPHRGPGPRHGHGPGHRPGGPFGPGFGGPWGPWGGGRAGNLFGWPGGPGRGGWGGPGKGWPGGPGKGWMGGQRGPRAGRGDVRLAILALLAEQPMHGYQLIQEISGRSAGAWKPSPGSVYPTLQQLEDEGLVHAEEREGKRVYALTDAGRSLADERAEEFASMWDAYQPNDDDAALGDLVFGVASAFVHVMRTGSDRQIAAARGGARADPRGPVQDPRRGPRRRFTGRPRRRGRQWRDRSVRRGRDGPRCGRRRQ